MSTGINDLFNKSRFTNLTSLSGLIFLVYAPLGIALTSLRICISFQYLLLLALLPKQWFIRRLLMRVYCFFMGVIITSSGSKHKNKDAKVIVSNHISYLDEVAIESIIPSLRLRGQSKLPSLFCWLFDYKEFGLTWKQSVRKFLEEEQRIYSCFPEEATTNGENGLLKFADWPFEMSPAIVQPAVILANRPWFIPVNVSYIHSDFWADLFWTLYIPFTQYHLSYLPCRKIPDKKEEIPDFVKTLQKDMAYVLAVEATNFTAADKSEYKKRLLHEERRVAEIPKESLNLLSPRPAEKQASSGFDQMIKQVKSVLPHVPMEVVTSNLKSTKDVDVTIAHLLDGSIHYEPLSESQQKEEQKQLIKREKIKSNFGRSTEQRTLNFEEKKRLMFETGRRRYLQLHPES